VRITRIASDRSHRGSKSIYADGEYLTSISAEMLIRSGLRVGDDISEDTLQAIQHSETVLSAKTTALRFLSYRPRTEREVRDKLREKEFPENEITAAIADLKKSGLLNDAEFARMYIQNVLAARPVGKTVLRQKMLLLGLDRTTAEAALEGTFKDLNQEEVAMEAAVKFVSRVRNMRTTVDRRKLRGRVTSFLARRGFPWDVVNTVVRRLLTADQLKEDSE